MITIDSITVDNKDKLYDLALEYYRSTPKNFIKAILMIFDKKFAQKRQKQIKELIAVSGLEIKASTLSFMQELLTGASLLSIGFNDINDPKIEQLARKYVYKDIEKSKSPNVTAEDESMVQLTVQLVKAMVTYKQQQLISK